MTREELRRDLRAWQYVAEFLHGRLQIDSRSTGRKVDSLGAYFERAQGVYQKERDLSEQMAQVLEQNGYEDEAENVRNPEGVDD